MTIHVDKKLYIDKPCRLVTVFCDFTGATAADGLLGGTLAIGFVLLGCVSFFFGCG